MLFKLSFGNVKKSFKDYAIYFLTLVLGVAIFYMFNSLDSQQAMMDISNSQRDIIQLLINLLSVVSVFVAGILGLLIVYANSFLINRRKKEFGTYMMLGMGKKQISLIIVLETVFVGLISLGVGLVVGIFFSQLMSILVGKLFQANMSSFEFVFSKQACIKTCAYFALMYVLVLVFNTFAISRYKLISLLNATKKNEKIKLKNPLLSIVIFLISVAVLSYCYYKVTVKYSTISTFEKLLPIICMGVISTFLIFWSLSGFVLKMVEMNKKIYLKGTNMFVLKQLNNKINTNTISMTVICLMLFLTISILSTALSLRNTMEKSLSETTPVDLNIYKMANLPEELQTGYGLVKYDDVQREDSKHDVEYTLKQNGVDLNVLKDVVQLKVYTQDDIKIEDTLGSEVWNAKQQYPFMEFTKNEEIVKVSDYNKVARLYGIEEFDLEPDEYVILCDFENVEKIRNKSLEQNTPIEIKGKQLLPKYESCQDGFIEMSSTHSNTGIILVPDDIDLTDDDISKWFLVANYNYDTEEEKEEIEKIFTDESSNFGQRLNEKGLELDGTTKISLIQSSVGLVTIVLFVAIYLGVIFLIASSAILALKQLTESSDNIQRYAILRKIRCDEKLINMALFKQIRIFFLLPLVFAIIHSIFGIQFGIEVLSILASKDELIPSAVITLLLICAVYSVYFIATYVESKNIISEG